MLKVELTENYAGVTIYGDYNDLDFLYDSINYLLPDLFLDMVLIKHFIRKVDKKVNDVYNPYINMVNYFYSLVLHSLENMLTEIKFNKIKKGLLESVVTDSIFIPQWFEIISIDYSKMNKGLMLVSVITNNEELMKQEFLKALIPLEKEKVK